MASFSAQISNIARKIVKPGASSSSRVPQTAQLSLHMCTISASDPTTNTVKVQFNGTDEITEGIQVMHAYSADNVPLAGDLAYGYHNGTDFVAVGRLVSPPGTVTLS